jgi:flagellar biogenesis protein FliO
MEQLVAIGIVFALLGGAYFFLKNKASGAFIIGRRTPNSEKRLKHVERLVLGPQHVVHIVEADGASFLITTFQGGIHLHPLKTGFADVMEDRLHSLKPES